MAMVSIFPVSLTALKNMKPVVESNKVHVFRLKVYLQGVLLQMTLSDLSYIFAGWRLVNCSCLVELQLNKRIVNRFKKDISKTLPTHFFMITNFKSNTESHAFFLVLL